MEVEPMWREGYVRGGRTRFFVRELGGAVTASKAAPEAPLIVLLHGWPEDATSWRHVAPQLADAGFRVACPDLKGFGWSDHPRRGYDPETLADEISQLIRNLHSRKAFLVGHDWGGAVALATAFRHPGRVLGLVTASSPFRQLDLRAAWHVPLLNLPVIPHVAFRAVGGPIVRSAIRHAAVVQTPFTDEVLDAYVQAVCRPHLGWIHYYRTLSRRAVLDRAVRQVRRRAPFLPDPDRAHQPRVPTTVVWGERDPATPYALAPQVARDLDADLVGIPDVGHFVHEEAPDAFAAAVLTAAAAVDGSARSGDRAG